MPTTFYQRLQEYRKRPDAVQFSKKKLKRLSGCINHAWDKRPENGPPRYVQSEEGAFEVRQYPNSFIKTIDGLIYKFHASAKTARKRKRIPVKAVKVIIPNRKAV